MPVIEVARRDLERLVGRGLSDREIMDLLPRVKCEIEELEPDKVSYEAPHDRPDLFSVEGLARAIRSLLGLGRTGFVFEDPGVVFYSRGVEGRPYVAFAIVEDLDLDDEAVRQILGLQEKLHITYCRNRRKASIGLYDLDTIKPPVYYELADPDETRFRPLDHWEEMSLREVLERTGKGREYRGLLEGWSMYPILRDSVGRILSMPPIINSEDTRVTPGTRRVLIDSTGVDPGVVVDMVTIVATSIAERSRSRRIILVHTRYPDGSEVVAPRTRGPRARLRPEDASSLLGIKVSPGDIAGALKRMGYRVSLVSADAVEAEAPPYRLDVLGWVDLAEDVAMAIGYDTIGSMALELPPARHPGRIHPIEHISRRLRVILAGMGLTEVVSYMMSSPWIQNEVFGAGDPLVSVSNPKMEKYTCLRRWLTPGLLEFIAANTGKKPVLRVFEIGDVAIVDEGSETGARIERRLGIAIAHPRATITDGLAVLRTLFETLGLGYSVVKKRITGLLEQRSAAIMAGGEEIGFIGEADPRALARLGIETPVVVAEINISRLLRILGRSWETGV